MFNWEPMELSQGAWAGGQYAGLFDSIKSGLAAVVPTNTIVGKWASGDTSGAAAAAGKLAGQMINPPKATGATIAPVRLNPQPASGFSAFMSSPNMPLYLGGAVLAIGAAIYLGKRRR